MDLHGIIGELIAERNRLNQLIEKLEAQAREPSRENPPKRRGRKFMDAAGRKEVSERMKRYWAMRRLKNSSKAPGAAPHEGDRVSPSGPGCADVETGNATRAWVMSAGATQ